ncbi:MAG TPA: FHA domain-containing protein [Ktedonobacterales bacterium]|nr:FHA domain-containing protein [Ktedonobacterales bacterium]
MQGALLGPFGRCELGNGVVRLGRAPSNTIVLQDRNASGYHAEVRPEGAGYVLLDLGSANGTLLNGQPLLPQMPQPLQTGDVITIGLVRMTVDMASGTASMSTMPLASSHEAAYAPTERLASPPGGNFAPTQRVAASNLPTMEASPAQAPQPPPPRYELPIAPPPPLPPPYVLPSPPKKRSTRKWILLGVGGGVGVLVLFCVCVGLLLYTIYTHSPEGVTQQYYKDIQSRDYAAAYTLLGSGFQQLLTLEAQQNHLATGQQLYTATFLCLDGEFGPVTAYATKLVGQGNGVAAVDVAVTRPKEHYGDPIRLLQESQGWKINFFLLPPDQQCFKTSAGTDADA